MARSLIYKTYRISQPPRTWTTYILLSELWFHHLELRAAFSKQGLGYHNAQVDANIQRTVSFLPGLKHEQSGGFLHPWACRIGWWAVSGQALKVCANGPALGFAFRTGTKDTLYLVFPSGLIQDVQRWNAMTKWTPDFMLFFGQVWEVTTSSSAGRPSGNEHTNSDSWGYPNSPQDLRESMARAVQTLVCISSFPGLESSHWKKNSSFKTRTASLLYFLHPSIQL